MSISSLIGGEATTAQSAAQQSPPNAVRPLSPPIRGMRPPSPRRRPSLGSRVEFGAYRRAQTPEMHSSGSVARPNDLSAYATSSSPRLFAGAGGSPDQARHSFPHATHNHGTLTALGARPYQSSPSDPDNRDSDNRTGPAVPPRPNSQPAALFAPPPELGVRDRLGAPVFRHPFLGPSAEDRGRMLQESHQQTSGGSDPTDRSSQQRLEGERATPAQPPFQSAFGPPQGQQHPAPQNGPSQPPSRTFLGWPQLQDARLREASKPAREESSASSRSGFSSQVAGNQGQGIPTGLGADAPGRQPHTLDQLRQRLMGQYPGTSRDGERRTEPPPALTPLGGANSVQSRAPSFDHPIRRPGEDMQLQRSLLGISPEASRRTGRASPLPQAVQGVQAQLVGPSGDPNIKSEFGRMFGGLGGLGSAPAGNGTSTPSRQSPMPQNGAQSLPPSNDNEGARMARTGSQAGRRGRRVKDEDALVGSESGDGRGTPGLGRGGSKRAKHAHPAHHHHHHPHSHQYYINPVAAFGKLTDSSHHHHHHKPDDDLAIVGAPQPANNNPFSTLRFNNNTPQNIGGPAAHHHHHHHHPPHHHHHAPKATQAPRPSSPMPTKAVNSQPVLDSVAPLPREHLGSMLYTTSLKMPPLPTYRLDSKFQYESQHKPIPNFEGKENCTYTIRVPRYYLQPDQREEICLRRNVWGTEIYTDDSDPIAAAIHAGWIRGEWGEDVDPDHLLELATAAAAISNNNQSEDIPETMLEPSPSGPVVPPSNTDLHITILILPRLEKYAASTRFGLRSRAWGVTDAEHSGLSFKILRLDWVDEASGTRGEERGAEARRKRLQAALSLVEMFGGRSGGGGGGGGGRDEEAGRARNGTGAFGRVAQAVA